jgi:hypothetical protein
MGKITNPPLMTLWVDVNHFKKLRINPLLLVKLNSITYIYIYMYIVTIKKNK